jgi:predicted glutamine amidotransferase
MCRVLGCVAKERLSLRHELLEAPNPLVRQSEEHDSGWGVAVYYHGDGEEPQCVRFPEAAFADGDFQAATKLRGRIFNAHVRRATMGGLSPENTHPFCLGEYSFSHNGTLMDYPRLQGARVREPVGATDSEVFFNFVICHFEPDDPIESLRRSVTEVIDRTAFSGLNFLFSDGERLYAYRLGLFELHWLTRPGQLLVASERVTDERWHEVRQDVLLVCDPNDPSEEPHAERLVGDEVVERARIEKLDDDDEGLRGSARGEFAAQRAAKLAGTTPA